MVTAEDLPHLGGVAPELADVLPAAPIFNKMIFGLADDPALLGAVAQTNRKTAILTGLETDVCVAQSALGLLERGYRVVAVADAMGAPEPAHTAGLSRMREAGVVIVNVKNLYRRIRLSAPGSSSGDERRVARQGHGNTTRCRFVAS